MIKEKCNFCGKGEGHIPITDSETQKELLICDDCNELLYFKIPNVIKENKNYHELTIRELEKGIDEITDNLIEEQKLREK